MNKKMTTLAYLRKTGCTDFGTAFARAAGSIGMDAESNPDASYAVADVRDLMDYLFELQAGAGQKKDPSGGNRERPNNKKTTHLYYKGDIGGLQGGNI
jgi:hypothetical protein